MLQRTLSLTVAGTTRTEMYQGREHTVIPVVALVEGVVHAMNSTYPEFVSAKEFSRAPQGWNGRPVFLGHPVQNGRPVSGNTPGMLADLCIGTVFNTRVEKQKLLMDAWVDTARAAQQAPTLLPRIRAGEQVHISVGVLVETDDAEGTFNGKKYLGAWHDLVPDHLALLPERDAGACSWDMGCGVRAAAAKGTHMESMYSEWLEAGPETDALLKTLRNISQAERDALSADDFAGPDRSFPIAKPEDVAAAAQSLGRAKGNRDDIKAKILSIAKRKGADFEAQLPEAWKTVKQKNASKFVAFMSRTLAAFRASQPAEDMSATSIRKELGDALRLVEPGFAYVEDYYPDQGRVIYSAGAAGSAVSYPMSPGCTLYERAYTLGSNGEITINGNRIEVEPVTIYEPVDPSEDHSGPFVAKLDLTGYTDEEIAQARDPKHVYSAAAGKVISKQNMARVQSMHDHARALGAYCDPKSAKLKDAAAGAPCSCRTAHAPNKESEMNKTELATFLATATEDQLKALTAAVKVPTEAELKAAKEASELELKTAADAKIVADKKIADDAVAAYKVANQPKTATFDDVLATADADTRASINEGIRVAKERKAVTIKALKDTGRCDLTDAELASKSQSDLDTLVKLAGSNVRAAVDFGVNAPKQQANETQEVAAPPDLGAAVRAARGQKAAA